VLGIFVALLCIVLNGSFVAAEFAIVKVRATQFRSRVRRGERLAIAAEVIIARIDRYLSVAQIGVTIASLGLGWVGEPAVARLVNLAGERLFGALPGPFAHGVVDAFAFAILMYVHVLFGEVVPKLIAIQQSERTVLYAALPMRALYLAFRPVLYLLEQSSKVILHWMGMSADVSAEGVLSEEEIVGILAASAAQTPAGKAKSELVERVMRFAQRAARHSMVPRVDVIAFAVGTSGQAAYELVRQHQYSRVILTKGKNLDEVVGYLYTKDFLLHPSAQNLPDLTPLCRRIMFVAETQSGLDVLREMQSKHMPIAVVVDEYGGTSGIVTMEDLLEEIVGEIRDEFDEEPQRVIEVHAPRPTWDVDGRATLDELRAVGLLLDDNDLAETIGALVVERLGRLPRPGDTVELGTDCRGEVLSISRRRVTRVRVTSSGR
jgi:CBS domain containing-hemolysin-like protein